jgi:alcohol dehydrogenase class IV
MPVGFDFATAADVRFGSGRVGEVPAALAALGVTRALMVTGRTSQRVDAVRAAMSANGVDSVGFPVSGESSIDVVRAGAAALKDAGCNGVVGFGGGRCARGQRRRTNASSP